MAMLGPPVAKLRSEQTESTESDETPPTPEEKIASLQKFRQKDHSLRLSASKIAACAGLNPWACLPKLVIDLIYQGRNGRGLLLQDADNLGLKLQTDEEILYEMAKKAGKETAKALKASLEAKPTSVKTVEELRTQVVESALKSKKLKKSELKALEDGVRHAVNTGFGTTHEHDALDLYEKMFGWEVRERNAVIREWPFTKHDGDRATVVPMADAKDTDYRPGERPQLINKEKEPDNRKKRRISDETTEPSNDASVHGDNSCTSPQTSEGATDTESTVENSTDSEASPQPPNDPKESTKEEPPKPFFTILGAVDGIRDEILCEPNDDDWSLRPVIIEMKHRMRKATVPPPLYDQIQAVAYCYMYSTETAEIVQAVRTSKEDDAPKDKPTEECPPEYQITVSRVALDDPLFRHAQNWDTIVLPRLRSFVEMVYRFRRDDMRRYQLLLALADLEKERHAWELIMKECHWLKDCDTAFHKI